MSKEIPLFEDLASCMAAMNRGELDHGDIFILYMDELFHVEEVGLNVAISKHKEIAVLIANAWQDLRDLPEISEWRKIESMTICGNCKSEVGQEGRAANICPQCGEKIKEVQP